MKLPDIAYKGVKPLEPTDNLLKGNPSFSLLDLKDFVDRGNKLFLEGYDSDLSSLIETRASTQSVSERWGRGLKKAGANAGSILAGGSVFMFDLAKMLVSDGDKSFFEAVIDSEGQQAIDSWADEVRENNKHYLTQAQQDYSTAQKLYKKDSGFWSDHFLGAVGFLAGTVASQYLNFGVGSLLSKAAKSLSPIRKTIKQASTRLANTARADEIITKLAGNNVNISDTLKKLGNVTLSTLTNTAGESALEARGYKEHATKELINQFKQINFREPNEQELKVINDQINSAGNSVFALNMVTVGLSNAIMFGKVLGQGTRVGRLAEKYGLRTGDTLGGLNKNLLNKARRKILGGVDITDGTAAVKMTGLQKKTRAAATFLGRGLSEGAEEGLQYAYETGAIDYLLSNNNLEALDNISLIGGVTNKGFAEAFGTQEGLEQVLVGALLGWFGLPIITKGGLQESIGILRGKDDYTKNLTDLAVQYNQNPETGLHQNLASAVREHEFGQRRMNAQDLMTMHDNRAAQTFSFFNSRNNLNVLNEEVDRISDTILNMSNEDFLNTYSKDKTIENVEEAKKELVDALKDSAKSFNNAHKAAKRLNNDNYETQQDKDYVDGLAFLTYNIQDLDLREGQIAENIKKIMPSFNENLAKLADELNTDIKIKSEDLDKAKNNLEDVQSKIIKENERLTNVKDEAERDKIMESISYLSGVETELTAEVNGLKNILANSIKGSLKKNIQSVINKTKGLEYANDPDAYIDTISDVLKQQSKVGSIIEDNTNTRLEFEKLYQEVIDLGRIAKKRQSLIAQYNLFSANPDALLETTEALRGAVNERFKFDLIKQHLLDKKAKEEGLYDKATFSDAMRDLAAILHIEETYFKDQSKDVESYALGTALNKDNEIKGFAIVKYVNGDKHIYEVEKNEGSETHTIVQDGIDITNVNEILANNVEESSETFTINEIIDTKWTPFKEILLNKIPVEESDFVDIINNLNTVLKLKGVDTPIAEIKDSKLNIGVEEIELSVDNYSQIAIKLQTVLEDVLKLSDEQELDNFKTVLNTLYPGEYSDAKIIHFSNDKTDIDSDYYNSIRQYYQDNTAMLVQLIAKKYPPVQVLEEINNAKAPIDLPVYLEDQVITENDYFTELGRRLRNSEDYVDKADEEFTEPNTENTSGKPDEIKPTKESLDELTGVSSEEIINEGDDSLGANLNIPKNVASYARRNIAELFTGGLAQETHDKASALINKIRRSDVEPTFRLRFSSKAKLDSVPHKVRINGEIKESNEVKHARGFTVGDSTYFFHLQLLDPETEVFIDIGQMVDVERFVDMQDNPLDMTVYENIKKVYPDIDESDLEGVSNIAKAFQEFKATVVDYIINNPEAEDSIDSSTLTDIFNTSGIKMDKSSLLEYAFVDDKDKNKVRQLASEFPEAFSILGNYPPDLYGIDAKEDGTNTPVKVLPYISNGNLVNTFGVVNGKLEILPVTKADRDKIRQIVKQRQARNNENYHAILITDKDGYKSVDINTPGLGVQAIDAINAELTDLLLNNVANFKGSEIGNFGTFTISPKTEIRSAESTAIDVEIDDTVNRFDAKPEDDQIFIKANKYGGERSWAEISLIRRINTPQGKLFSTPIKFKFNKNPQNKIELSLTVGLQRSGVYQIYDEIDIVQVMQDINKILNDNKEDVNLIFSTIETVEVIKEGSKQKYENVKVTNPESLQIDKVESLSIRNKAADLANYIVVMMRNDVANTVVKDGKRLIPNIYYAEFDLKTPEDTSIIDKDDYAESFEEDTDYDTQTEPKPQAEPEFESEGADVGFQQKMDKQLEEDIDAGLPYSIGQPTNKYKELGVDIDTLLKDGTVKYTDETGTECAKAGMSSAKFTAGSKWSLVKDLKNMPTHEQGGVDLIFKDGGYLYKGNKIKAEDGLVISSDPPNKILAKLNPKNWGVKDYTDKGNFDSAYSSARKAGKKEFMWNNKRYSSDIDRDRTQNSFNLSEEERKKIYNSINPTGYPDAEIFPGIKRYITGELVPEEDIIDDRKGWTPNQDSWAFFMGLPQINNTVTESKYKPSISKNENSKYYTIRNAYPNFNEIVIKDASNALNSDNTKSGVTSSFTPLENVKYSKGKDERGDFYSIYDIYDFSIPFENKIGKPYDIYDRVYYKDYGDGNKKPMYYTDEELNELNLDEKNFDTLALQKELSNRGYKLSESTKKDGFFDGIYGEETKQALLDWQTKNKKN